MNITPDQYIKETISNYPSLYASFNSYEESKIKVLDQLFNVIGNGIRDDEELMEEMNFIPTDNIDIDKLLNSDLYYGYYKTMKVHKNREIGEGDFIVIPDDERKNHPDIKLWDKISRDYGFNPYPNFKEDFSTVYKCPIFLTFGDVWISEAIEFYLYCKEWLVNNEGKYHGAYPSTGKDNGYLLKNFRERLKTYSNNEEISKAYKCEYNGDLEDFVRRRWLKERNRIFKFIDDTVIMLKSNLKE